MMELWASGFNAWGHLDFEEVSETEPRDLRKFKCILRDERIEVVRTTLSATLVRTSAGLRTAGCSDSLIKLCTSKNDSLPNLAIAGNDKVVSQHHLEHQIGTKGSIESIESDPSEDKASFLKQYSCLKSYLENDGEKLWHYNYGDTRQIVAGQCTFTALSVSGDVWTWGDGRYEACIGREISEMKPVTRPCVVEDLSELPSGPIRKISSGGYMTAALTEGNDLYVWGGRPGQNNVLEELTGSPMPVDLYGEDILDVAVGMNHVLALTTTFRLFAVGDNGNGQLGADVKESSSWEEVSLPLKAGQQIASVHTGYKNSLVVVVDIT